MAVTQRLDLRQSQSLVMTPQLRQAIELLQMSNLELDAFVAEAVIANPLLDRGEAEPDFEPPEPEAPRPERLEATDRVTADDNGRGPEGLLDADYSNLYDNSDHPGEAIGYQGSLGPGGVGAGGGRGFAEAGWDPADGASGPASLRQHLLDQAGCDLDDPGDRLIAEQLIGLLDDAGYLSAPAETLAPALNVPEQRVAAVLARLQQCDPPGVFAADLKECLALQLKDQNRFDPAMAALIDNLDLLASGEIARLKKLCAVDDEDFAEMVAELRRLDPKPGLQFGPDPDNAIEPDVLMTPSRDTHGWIVELNPNTLPRVLVNRAYLTEIGATARQKEEKTWLNEQLSQANWLTRALDQRATTILKVAGEIVKRQDAFFREGVSGLKPLILRDVAEAIEMHESTVSRVTSNKFIATPRGTFELKYFFTVALASSATNGAAHSAEAVRHRIRTLIDGETADTILSDDQIVMKLRLDGIEIARRTVAKYREAMGLPSSSRRRRLKRAGM